MPGAVRFALRPVPLSAVRFAAARIVDGVVRRHPALLSRIGPYAATRFLIDPSDLPFLFQLKLGPGRPRIDVRSRGTSVEWDARITGPLAALIGMLHGAVDGDALFFSRDLQIEGDTEAIVALRNAVDDAEIDLVKEAAAILGPFGSLAERSARIILPALERLTGVALSRSGQLAT